MVAHVGGSWGQGLPWGLIPIILGTGPEEELLRNLIKNLQLEKNIFLMGFDKKPYRWISNCDLFVLSSINEGFGNVIAEAMALPKTIENVIKSSISLAVLVNESRRYSTENIIHRFINILQ